MFIGRYYHTVDDKGRVSLPKALREEETQNTDWVITRGLDGGLFLFTQSTFKTRLAELANRTFTRKRDRDFVRYMTNDAYRVSCDSHGRVLLPEYLRKFAQVSKDVVIVGSFEYIEVWDVEQYHQYLDALETEGEQLAESIHETPTSSTQ
jgi:MraZ protein